MGSILKPEVSLGVGLATVGVVAAVFMNANPSVADIRVGDVGNRDIESTTKQAAWVAAGVVGAVSLVAKDPSIFTLGGVAILAFYWTQMHANMVDPVVGKAVALVTPVADVPSTTYDSSDGS